MGNNVKHYVILGVNVGCDAVDIDKYESEIGMEDGRRFDLLYDGMNGEYAVAGKILAECDQYTGFPLTNLEAMLIDVRSEIYQVHAEVTKDFPFADFDKNVAIFAVSHHQ